MLRNVYLGIAGFMLIGYLGWSVMGMETGGLGKDPLPKEPRAGSSSSSGYYGGSRSGGGFFGGGGGFGK